jgi:anti-anti-sigma regulatory factor
VSETKFEAEIEQLDDLTFVKLGGTIDEDNELVPLAGRIRGNTAVIALAGITEINNCGVRDWVRWLAEVQSRSEEVVLIECSPAIVQQLNQVSNFAGKAYVKSFYVPYFCQACDEEKAILVDIDELRVDAHVSPPTARCDACDGVMAFDDLEESYFSFVRELRHRPPAVLKERIAQLAPAPGERKVLSGSEMASSLFTGIPSSAAEDHLSRRSAGHTTSIPSAGALRRLRDKTGLRSTRRAAEVDDLAARRHSRRRLLVALALLAGLGLALAAALL